MNSPFSTFKQISDRQRPISEVQFLESSFKIIYEISAPDLLAMHVKWTRRPFYTQIGR